MDDRCPSCPLMPFTVGVAEQVVGRAFGEDPAPPAPGPRHGQRFDPNEVAAARRHLEQSIKDGEA